MALVYPVTLPQFVLNGATEKLETYTIRTQMDVGPPKVRRRATKIRRAYDNCSLIFTLAQKTEFETWFIESLKHGSLSFDWKDPMTNQTKSLRFVGDPSTTRISQNVYKMDFQLEEP